MSLRDFCKHPVVKISPDQNVLEACSLLKKNNIGCIVVEKDAKLCGIVTDRDIALKVTGENRDPQVTKVREIMTPSPVRASVNNSLPELTALMHAFHVRRVPVVNGSHKTVGIITLDDVITLLGVELADIGKSISQPLFGRRRDSTA
jgi:CBS domain-containing protein